MASGAERTDLGPLASAFRAQVRRRVAERIPLGLAILLGCALTGAALEWINYPERRGTLLLTDLLFIMVAGGLLGVARRRADLSVLIGVIGVNAIGIGSNLYHWTSGASAERSLLIVTALCSLCAIILPWGWRAQAMACIGPVASYVLTVFVSEPHFGWSGHLVADGPLSVLVVYPLIVVGLSVLGAELTERYLRSDFVLTRALRERELRLAQAKEVAEGASRAKTDFLASMSHEIRTPINVIFGMTDMALDSELSLEQRSALQRTRGAASTLLVLVNDILDFARIEARKLHLAPRSFQLRDWLRDTLDPLAFSAQDKGLELSWTLADDVPQTVLGDRERLAQVLVNLVNNAIKFTPEGTVRVAVRRSDPDDGRLLHFEVADTGVGIAPAQQREIFEAFVQGETARTMRASGAGLGLTVCSRLVRLMEGQLWVDSEPGHGSRFHFTAQLLGPARHAGLVQAVGDTVAA
jgi:signal transduction histidine kinase